MASRRVGVQPCGETPASLTPPGLVWTQGHQRKQEETEEEDERVREASRPHPPGHHPYDCRECSRRLREMFISGQKA